MAKIHFLGTCSGTEPMKNMHHTSTLLEVDGYLYWFDAGECCVHTAYTSGVDVMKSRAVFVTHPHIDHVGGLANLLFVFDKMIIREGRQLINENELDIFFPHPELLHAIKDLSLSGLRDNFKFKLKEHTVLGVGGGNRHGATVDVEFVGLFGNFIGDGLVIINNNRGCVD